MELVVNGLHSKAKITFVGIRSKWPTFKSKNNVVKKAKGVRKVVVKKNISFDDYTNCVLNDEPKNVNTNAIRTVKMIDYSSTRLERICFVSDFV